MFLKKLIIVGLLVSCLVHQTMGQPRQSAGLTPTPIGDKDLQLILKDVDRLVKQQGTAPGVVCAFGENAIPLILGSGNMGQIPVAVIAKYKKGRVAAFGHDSMVNGNFCTNNEQLAVNLFQWLAGDNYSDNKSNKQIRVLVVNQRTTADFLNSHGFSAEYVVTLEEKPLESFDVVCFGDNRINDKNAKIVEAFVSNGGGVLTAATGWGWLSFNTHADLRTDFSPNRLFAPMGLVWTSAIAGETCDEGYLVTPDISSYVHPRIALKAFLNEKTRNGLTKTQADQAICSVEIAIREVPKKYLGSFDVLKKLLSRKIVPTTQNPIRATESPLDRLAIIMQTEHYMYSQRKNGLSSEIKVPVFEAAADFPGSVPKNAKRTTETIPIDTSLPDWHSTGLYAAPGDVVTISIPESVANHKNKFAVRIGVWSDTLWHCDHWDRYPEISLQVALTKQETKVANPFGGHVYIVVPRNIPKGTVSVTIQGAVRAPYFVAGKTSKQDWLKSREEPAPWAELASRHVIVTVPSEVIRKLDDPETVMQFWDSVFEADAKLVGFSSSRERPERITVDRQISAGWLHSGYPVMGHLVMDKDLVDIKKLRAGDWGFFHEFGHNHQKDDWTFDGTVEVTVNLFSLYNYEMNCGISASQARSELYPETRKAKKEKYMREGAPFEKWKKDPFLALVMYVELIDAFGWKPFQEVFRDYNDLQPGERPKNDEEKRDQWLVRMSKKTGKNLGPFFQQWGVPTSQQARDSVAHLPEWLP